MNAYNVLSEGGPQCADGRQSLPTSIAEELRRASVQVRGLHLPTWQDVLNREYESWSVSRIVLNTANKSPEDCVDTLIADLAALEA